MERNVKTGRIMGVACLEFRGENFHRRLKNCKIHESFLPQSLPLYGMYGGEFSWGASFHYFHG